MLMNTLEVLTLILVIFTALSQDQNKIVKILNTYNELLRKEKDILELYKKQKAYLLKNMFI